MEKTTDTKRLNKNWQALLDVLPQIVVLVRADFVIEYINRHGKDLLGDLRGNRCMDALCTDKSGCHVCPVKESFVEESRIGVVSYAKIGDMDVELSVVPFHGYSGDMLCMILMHDITMLKRQEQELQAFNHDIEGVLRRKINELKDNETVRKKLAKEVNLLKQQMVGAVSNTRLLGSSRAMQAVRDMILQVADTDANILITGESGTGKELVADALQAHGSRNDKRFLKVNCSAINENLLESDLFGYEKGAFTGAAVRQKGKFEIVEGGTLFLDEIGDISPRMQSSLLRVLQSGELIRVGGNSSIQVDVRIIAATNVDLVQAVQEKRFRLDLYYRLNIIKIPIPPLRERKEDILELASHFVKRYRKAFQKEIDFLPSTIIDKLFLHDWPGNVRELENVIQRAVLMSKNNVITEHDLVFDGCTQGKGYNSLFNKNLQMIQDRSLKGLVAQFEHDIITHLLEENNGNISQVSQDLAICKSALYDKMKRFKVSENELKKVGVR